MPGPMTSPSPSSNPLLQPDALPAFSQIRPEHVEPAVRATLARQRARIAALQALDAPSFAEVVEPIEELQHELARIWAPVGHLNAVTNSDALRESYNRCLPLLSEFQTELAQSEALYRAYSRVAQHDAAALTAEQKRVVEQALRDFRLAGVALASKPQQRFKQIMMELAQRGASFEENVLDCMNEWQHHVTDAAQLAGVNSNIVTQAQARAAAVGKEGWLLGLDQPTYQSVMTEGESRPLRRVLYEAWSTRASALTGEGRWDNAPVIADILRLRQEAAELLGFASYAEYALATRMARSSGEVIEFLRKLARAARPAAEREFAELQAFAGQSLEAWDVAFWSERLQRSRHNVSQEALRPWFPLPRVLEGLFEVAGRLFGIQIRERRDVDTWHDSVRYFELSRDHAGRAEVFGAFYLDPYARPKKRNGAWMDQCIGRKSLPSGSALPVAHLVCNFLPPQGDAPALLTHTDVVTLFHEFGHGLHHLMTCVDYPSLAGINGVAWDAVELPSQFIENYAWQPEVLQQISAHIETGEPLTNAQQQQLIATQRFQAGLATLRQIELALFDFRLHSEYRPEGVPDLLALVDAVRTEVAVIKPPAWNRFPMSFSHIFAGGYAAGYYSYKWAEVLAADTFAAFTENGAFDSATARRFVDTILARGGTRDALDAFVEFRGRPPDIGPLLRQHGIAV